MRTSTKRSPPINKMARSANRRRDCRKTACLRRVRSYRAEFAVVGAPRLPVVVVGVLMRIGVSVGEEYNF